jgi:hypothetical protein
MHHAQGHCDGGESSCQARVRVFFSEQIPVTLPSLQITVASLLFIFLNLFFIFFVE